MGLTNNIRKIVEDQLDDKVELTEQTKLFSSGLLSSLELVVLITDLENEFDLKIQPEEVDNAHFDTIENLVTFIKGKLETNG